MANIIITHFSGIFFEGRFQSSCFYDGLVKSLQEHGHSILQVITSDFLFHPWNKHNNPISRKIKHQALEEVKKFRPDLIISFNNSSIEDIDLIVECPILLLDADSCTFFNDKDKIRKNLDRYHFGSFSTHGLKDYKNFFSVKDNKMCRIPPATSVVAKSSAKTIPISFIGSPFFNNHKVVRALTDHPYLLNFDVEQFELEKGAFQELLKEYDVTFAELQFCKAGPKRMKVINALFDNGIKVFGPQSWKAIAPFFIDILKAYDPTSIFSLEQNQNIYNSSTISLSVSHTQNITGYPWRVPDILASSSVLLTDYSSDLVEDVGNSMRLQIYHSPHEAFLLTQKLLKDEYLLKELIHEQNEVVERKFRWHHRFTIIRELTGVDLSLKSTVPATYKRLQINYSNIGLILEKVSGSAFCRTKPSGRLHTLVYSLYKNIFKDKKIPLLDNILYHIMRGKLKANSLLVSNEKSKAIKKNRLH